MLQGHFDSDTLVLSCSCSSEGSLHINDEITPSSNERQSSEYDADEATPSPIARGRARRRRRDRAEDQDYKDGDYGRIVGLP